MRRATVGASRALMRAARFATSVESLLALAAAVVAISLALSGCGKKKAAAQDSLTLQFEPPGDTTALARGEALLTEFEPYRASDGALRVRGRLGLPNGTRVQLSVRRAAGGADFGVVQMRLVNGAFDTPPLFEGGNPPPTGRYAFDMLAQFNPVWQPAHVLAATRQGLDLRGPGMRRGTHGEAIFELTLEKRL